MISISCKNLYKSFGINEILSNISFSIQENEKIGLVGANGVGKSTLLKILTRELSQDIGDVFIDKNKILGYFSQTLDLDINNTIWEEMLLIFDPILKMEQKLILLQRELESPYDDNSKYHEKLIKQFSNLNDKFILESGLTYKASISKILVGIGFTNEEFNKPISILSGGEKTRVALSKLLLKNPDILILDEPTNHLDLASIKWLEDYLKELKKTILVISHDRFFLDSFSTSIFELEKKKMRTYKGNYSEYIIKREKDFEIEMKAYLINQKEIQRQEDIIKKFKSFNSEKSIKAAQSREKQLSKLEVLEKPISSNKHTKIKLQSKIQSGFDVLNVENLSKCYGDRMLFENVSFEIKRGDRTALIGDNGIGKSTLLKILLSKINSFSGNVIKGTNIKMMYYDQEQSDLNLENTIFEEILDNYPKLTITEIRSSLASFLFQGDDVFKKISLLSGGEKCRINLLKLMLSNSNFLLLDEPTNHLDILSREALEKAILNYNGTILLISHDRYFLNKITNKILELKKNGLSTYLGNYSYYINKKSNPDRYKSLKNKKTRNKTKLKEEIKNIKIQQKYKREEEKKANIIEKSIQEKESKLYSLNENLCKEKIYSNYQLSNQIRIDIENLNKEIESLYIDWENII